MSELPHRIEVDADLGALAMALGFLRPGVGIELVIAGQGALIVRWESEAPIPTDAEIAQALIDAPAAQRAKEERVKQKKDRQKADAASAVGKKVSALKMAEQTALLELLVERAGGLDEDGNVRPIEEWT